MLKVNKSEPKSQSDLTREWDLLANERDRQLRSGVDISFHYVVAPIALRLLESANHTLLIDAGCGTGHFSALMSPSCGEVLGVDPSSCNIAIARGLCKDLSNVRFIESSIEDVSIDDLSVTATAVVALMVLMTTPNLVSFANSVNRLLPTGGMFVAVIPHPCFWPTYWGYADEPWFKYSEETFIEAPFKITNEQTTVQTTHIHRPLGQYLTTFSSCGFRLDVIDEPMPSQAVESMYPEPWRIPRFLAIRWIKA